MRYWPYDSGDRNVMFRGEDVPDELYIDNRRTWQGVIEFIGKTWWRDDIRKQKEDLLEALDVEELSEAEAVMSMFEWDEALEER